MHIFWAEQWCYEDPKITNQHNCQNYEIKIFLHVLHFVCCLAQIIVLSQVLIVIIWVHKYTDARIAIMDRQLFTIPTDACYPARVSNIYIVRRWEDLKYLKNLIFG